MVAGIARFELKNVQKLATFSPVSSRSSRIAAPATASPISTLPPGRAHLDFCLRTSRIRLSFSQMTVALTFIF